MFLFYSVFLISFIKVARNFIMLIPHFFEEFVIAKILKKSSVFDII